MISSGQRWWTVCFLMLAGGVGVLSPNRALAQSRGVEFGILSAASVASGGPLSAVETTRFNSIEVEVGVPLVRREAWSLEALVAVLPYAWASETSLGSAIVGPNHERWLVPSASGRTTSRGVGFRPLGLRFLRGTGPIKLQAHASGGVIRFTVPTPAANATTTNFTGELGLGFRVPAGWGTLGAGYRWHHLSNAGRGRVNPGIDSHQLYFGVWVS